MPIEEQVIWECFVMRRDRDLERLWQKAQAGDPLGCKFFDGFGEWREKCRKAPDATPQCLTCEHAFCDPTQPPLTFVVIHTEDPRVNQIILTGVCWRCAEKSDAQLRRRSIGLLAKHIEVRTLGECHPASQIAH
jgi:hypothetical protein